MLEMTPELFVHDDRPLAEEIWRSIYAALKKSDLPPVAAAHLGVAGEVGPTDALAITVRFKGVKQRAHSDINLRVIDMMPAEARGHLFVQLANSFVDECHHLLDRKI